MIIALGMMTPGVFKPMAYSIILALAAGLFFLNYFLVQEASKNVGKIMVCSLLFLCLLFPGAGNLITLLFVASTTLWLKPYRDLSHYELLNTKESIFSEATQKKKPLAISEILNDDDNEARRKATLSLRSLNQKFAIPILNRAVQDSDEEVRLYATNILKKFNEQKEKKIQKLNKTQNAVCYNRLAEEHMDSVYVGLVDDPLSEKLEYDKAEEFLAKSLQESRTPKKLYRLLKLKIFQRELDSARQVLDELLELNFPRHLLRPWEAELAYRNKDWKLLVKILGDIEPIGSSKSINTVLRQWIPVDELEYGNGA